MSAPRLLSQHYRRIAEMLRLTLASGVLRVGDRMISARKLAEREQVSLPTALEALRCLEAEGLIVARPRSGYFVCQINTSQNMPSSQDLPGPVPVTMSAVARSLFSSAEARLVPLGAALPDQYGCQQTRYSGRYRPQPAALTRTGRATACRREGQTCAEI